MEVNLFNGKIIIIRIRLTYLLLRAIWGCHHTQPYPPDPIKVQFRRSQASPQYHNIRHRFLISIRGRSAANTSTKNLKSKATTILEMEETVIISKFVGLLGLKISRSKGKVVVGIIIGSLTKELVQIVEPRSKLSGHRRSSWAAVRISIGSWAVQGLMLILVGWTTLTKNKSAKEYRVTMPGHRSLTIRNIILPM